MRTLISLSLLSIFVFKLFWLIFCVPHDGHRRKHGIPIQITDCTNDARFALYSTLESVVLRGHTCLRHLVLILLTMVGSERQFICNEIGNSVNLLRFLTISFDLGAHRPGNDAQQLFPRLGLKSLWLAQPLISLWLIPSEQTHDSSRPSQTWRKPDMLSCAVHNLSMARYFGT